MTKPDLQTDYVIIVPQTLVQPEMLKKIGENVVYVDETHCTTTTSSN